MKIIRTHDVEVFLNEDRSDKLRECFKFVAQQTYDFISSIKKPKILDIGCATGDFIFYLSSIHKNASYTGIDIIPELIAKAKLILQEVRFIIADVFSGKGLPSEKFNVIFLNGVHTIFDEYMPWIDNLLKLADRQSRIYVFSFFNSEEVDVLIKVRRSLEKGPWQSGWNIFSKKTISNYLEEKKCNFKFYDWNIGIDLPKNSTDPLRSWTFKTEDGTRLIKMGAQLILNFSLLEIIPNSKV